ncbi:MAG TPA: polysaccharide biosynthesis/export family protein [Vicinamibacterales bacterium]
MRTASLLALVTLLLTWPSHTAAAQSSATTKPTTQSPSTAKPAPQAPATAKPTPPQPAPAARGTATPTTSAAVPSDYVIGAEDVLTVLFWREADISGDVVVRPDGMITLPLLGEMKAAGIKPDVLREQIRVASGKFLTEPNVTIVVKQVNSRKVFITGNVMMPDSYPLTGPRTVMQLIALAGGLTEYADSQNISIIRQDAGGQTRSLKFNYKDVSKGKKLEQNVVLQPGDTVVVP